MPIDFSCTCGKSLHAPIGSQGKRARCPKCGSIVTVPEPAPAAASESDLYDTLAPAPRATSAVSTAPRPSPMLAQSTAPTYAGLRRFAYFLLLLAFIPLIISTFHKPEDTSERIMRTVAAHPDVDAQVDTLVRQRAASGDEGGYLTEEEVLNMLPDHRLDDALLSHDSKAHWLLAGGTGVFFFGVLLLLFHDTAKYTKGLIFAGIFTSTVGILLLIVFQFAAYSLPFVIPHGLIGLVILIVKLIGMSYRLADDPSNGFLLSFLGFTCGVGLCEEITKAIPLLFRIKPVPGKDDPTWNSLLIWGLASGFGFGIAEGIMYSGRYYNGIYGIDIYLIRFISCVALHAIWAGAVGISVYRHQGDLLDNDSNWAYWGRVIQVVWIPMVLHGLYDTLLKKEMNVLALLVALASFGWLAFQIERQQKAEPLGLKGSPIFSN